MSLHFHILVNTHTPDICFLVWNGMVFISSAALVVNHQVCVCVCLFFILFYFLNF